MSPSLSSSFSFLVVVVVVVVSVVVGMMVEGEGGGTAGVGARELLVELSGEDVCKVTFTGFDEKGGTAVTFAVSDASEEVHDVDATVVNDSSFEVFLRVGDTGDTDVTDSVDVADPVAKSFQMCQHVNVK